MKQFAPKVKSAGKIILLAVSLLLIAYFTLYGFTYLRNYCLAVNDPAVKSLGGTVEVLQNDLDWRLNGSLATSITYPSGTTIDEIIAAIEFYQSKR